MRNCPPLAAALLVLSACAGAPIPENQASIPFLSSGTVRDWEAADDNALYIEHMNGTWYRADFSGPCIGLPFATVIGFMFERGSSRFDRFGEIVVGDVRCQIASLTETPPPPSARATGRKARPVAGGDRTP